MPARSREDELRLAVSRIGNLLRAVDQRQIIPGEQLTQGADDFAFIVDLAKAGAYYRDRHDERMEAAVERTYVAEHDFSQMNMKNLTPKWTRFCWWISRSLGGRTVFGKRDET